MTQSEGDSWKITLPCSKAAGEAIMNELEPLGDLPEPPVLLAREPDPAKPDDWLLEAYFQTKPTAAEMEAVCGLLPGATPGQASVEHIPTNDWVTLSQQGLEPVHAGRFYVCTPAHAESIPESSIAFVIEAGRAFGTGQHETTTGCLMMLDRLKRLGDRFVNIADIGTGTGLLAFAAHRAWPLARVIASDIDPVSIEVTAENAAVNGITTGLQRNGVELVVAPGLAHPRLRRRAPYDLILANILAGPLIDLAPALSSALEPGGSLILAGLLDHQAEAVTDAYRRQGLRLARRIDRAEWPTLQMIKRRAR